MDSPEQAIPSDTGQGKSIEMPDLSKGLVKLSCSQRDVLFKCREWSVYSSLTDMSGQFGDPRIKTVWIQDGTNILLEDNRFLDPDTYEDIKPCEHWYDFLIEEDNDE